MLAQVSRYEGRYRDASAQLQLALRAFEVAGDPDGAATVRASLAEVARDAGEPDRARDLFRQALRGHQQTGSKRGMAYDLEGLAAAAALTGDGRAALTYLSAAQALREQSGGPLMPIDQPISTGSSTPAWPPSPSASASRPWPRAAIARWRRSSTRRSPGSPLRGAIVVDGTSPTDSVGDGASTTMAGAG